MSEDARQQNEQGWPWGNKDWLVEKPSDEPYRYVCRIEAVTKTSSSGYQYAVASGFLVTPYTIVTAAHALWTPSTRYKQFNIGAGKFTPGDPRTMAQVLADDRYIRIHPNFLKAKTDADIGKWQVRNWDVAVIALPKSQAFKMTGNMFAYGELQGSGVPSGAFAGFGYPKSDDRHLHGGDGKFIQRDGQAKNLLAHDMVLNEGQSGCPLVPRKPDGSYGNSVYGIHLATLGADPNVKAALTFSAEVADFIRANTVMPPEPN